jgi:hypothetical protein
MLEPQRKVGLVQEQRVPIQQFKTQHHKGLIAHQTSKFKEPTMAKQWPKELKLHLCKTCRVSKCLRCLQLFKESWAT